MTSISSTFNAEGKTFCCGVGTRAISYFYKYAVGSVLYSCLEAKRGILEAVFIKSIRLTCGKYGETIAIYKDGNNWLWNEYDLCTETNARALAIIYFEAKLLDIEHRLENCGH